MKRFFTPLVIIGFLVSCISEKSTSPGKPTTFIRYYNGGFNDVAQTFQETGDQGFIILATTQVKTSDAAIPRYKIKLIKTDAFGNMVWQKLYPDFSAAAPVPNYQAHDLQILKDGGYVITGQDIQQDGTSKILIMTVDANGTITKSNSLPTPAGSSLTGQAVAVNAADNYLVLGAAGGSAMILTEIKNSDLTPVWANTYAAGQVTLTDRLYLDDAGKAFWSGTVVKSGVTGIRVIKTQQNSQNSEFDQFIIEPGGFTEVANDFARFGFGYAIVGSTDKKADGTKGDKDILFKRLGQDGAVLSSQSFPLGDTDTQNDARNSISSTQDGGLILLASVNSVAINGRGDDDYYLIKINAFGDKEWSNSFGSRFKDAGSAVRQASDGGYMILGTSVQGGLSLIMLAKTDKGGKIE